jgi:ABC-2 type transport system permease protein
MLAMAAYVVGVYDSLGGVDQLKEFYEQYPESIRDLFGEADFSTIDGWIHIELLSWMPLVLGIYGGIFAAGNVSREIEQRTLDFVLGLPVSRTAFILSRIAAGAVNQAVICALVWLLLVVEVALVGHTPSAGKYALALLSAYLLGIALFFGYVLIATFVDEQARLIGIAIGGTLVLYIATGVLRTADAPAPVRWLSPFEHYQSADIIAGNTVQVLPFAVLVVGAVVAGAAAIYCYNRRDLTT